MATRVLNWCTPNQLACTGGLPTSAWLVVTPSIVVPAVSTANAYVAATLTAVRQSTCADPCGTCKWVYTVSYDDSQLVDGFALTEYDIKEILCGDYLTDFVVDVSCQKIQQCIGGAYCYSLANTEAELNALNDAGKPVVIRSLYFLVLYLLLLNY